MSEFSAYILFLAKSITIVIAILMAFGGIVMIATKDKIRSKERLKVTRLNKHIQKLKDELNREILGKAGRKQMIRDRISIIKAEKTHAKTRPRIFVLDFVGDLKASAVENLREEITAILTVATKEDKVLIKIESHGGTIQGYGLAASQLKRIRNRGVPLIATVDKIAASGGYMMASAADTIIAAPFAVIGSIGVITQLPNFNRMLKNHDIGFEQVMAGQYKRTLSLFGENTDEGRHKMQQDVEEAHHLFRNFVAENRPTVDINTIATGETWFGSRAKELNLVDELITSDDWLLAALDNNNIFKVEYKIRRNLSNKLSLSASKTIEKIWALAHVQNRC